MNIVRESPRGILPAVVATGPAAINQAMKAIAIARKYLLKWFPTDLAGSIPWEIITSIAYLMDASLISGAGNTQILKILNF